MPSNADVDGVDFRPFFDMVVGILFVLLILIGALLFFQQTSREEAAAREAERNARVLDAETTQFLAMVADDLRRHGLEAAIDLPNKSIGLPLASFAKVGEGGLPEVSARRVEDLGRVLADDLRCLVAAPQRAEPCAAYGLIVLNLASVEVATGEVTAAAALPRDQFARLLTAEFSTALFRVAPALLGLFNSAGAAAVNAAPGRLSASPPGTDGSLGGEVDLHFDFAPR